MLVDRNVGHRLVSNSLGFVALAAGVFGMGLLCRTAAAADVAPTRIDPAKVMGSTACSDCHKPAIAAWKASRHAVNFAKTLAEDKAKEWAPKVGVSLAEISRKGMCVECHGQRSFGTPAQDITGVSCESCHGASGGETGWLNLHGSYGAKGVTREMETPEHKKTRHAAEAAAGMVRPAQMYALAKNCFGCHTVPNESLQTKTDHPKGTASFELVSFVSGDVAHNLFLDPKKNAEAPTLWMAETKRTAAERKRLLFVFGQMADLDVSLRNLAGASAANAYTIAMKARATAAAGNLDTIKDLVPEVKPVVAEFGKLKLKLTPAHKADLLKAADDIDAAAAAVEKNHDGSKLGDLDGAGLWAPKGNGPRYDPTK